MLISESRVLIVDDMGTMRRVVGNYLRELGFSTIVEAAHGEEAWERMQDSGFDLVISDWTMPMMTGIELLKKVRAKEETKKTPFILLTVEADKTNIAEALKYHVDGYLMKPVSFGTISKKLIDVFKRLDPEMSQDLTVAANNVKT
jgi:two-component system chemotaxis response regulator CheY